MGNEMTPTEKAKQKFDSYAAMDAPDLPSGVHDLSELQVKLYRWQVHNFGNQSVNATFLGVVEEVGELSHALLKHQQKIRGLDGEAAFKEAAGDAIADAMVYLIQLCTSLRLDLGTLFVETATEVMRRNWKDNPETAHLEAASNG